MFTYATLKEVRYAKPLIVVIVVITAQVTTQKSVNSGDLNMLDTWGYHKLQ